MKAGLLATKPVIPSGWTRASVAILTSGAAWESAAVQEPSVIYDGTTWRMWYTGSYATPGMGYASCTGDPTVAANWTKYAGNPVLGQGGSGVVGWVSGVNVLKVGATYYAYFYDASGGGNLKVSTSSDGLAWGTPTTILASGSQGGTHGWANSFVWGSSGNWNMLVECSTNVGGGLPWRICLGSSTNMTPDAGWSTNPPISSLVFGTGTQCGGPWLYNGGATINGRYQLWYHVGDGNYTDIYHAYSTDASNWRITGPQLLHRGGSPEDQQAADASVIEVNNANGTATSYMFYSAIGNATQASSICVATYPSKLSNLVLWEP